eukprot:1160936-Pelagomonas_calceolata.AAC.28
MEIRGVTGSSPCLILVMIVERSLVKNASSASKFMSGLDRMSMKLQGNCDDCMSVKIKLFESLLSVGDIDDPAHKKSPHLAEWYGETDKACYRSGLKKYTHQKTVHGE